MEYPCAKPEMQDKKMNTRTHCLIMRERKTTVDYYSFAHCAQRDEVIVRPLITQAHSPDELVISTKKKGEPVPNGKRRGKDLRSGW